MININNAVVEKWDFYLFANILADKFPLLSKFKETPQDSIWHSEGDVEIHTDMVLKEIYKIINNEASHLSISDKKVLVLSALFHDICKPITTKEKEIGGKVRIISPKHEKMGMDYLFYKLHSLELTKKEILKIVNLVGYHQLPKLLVVKNMDKVDYLSLAQKVNLELIYFLELADMRGRECNDKKEQIEYLELFRLFSKDYGVWDSFSNPINDENFYVRVRGLKDYLDKKISVPEEASAKFFQNKNEYSHCYILCGLSGVGKSYYAKNIDGILISLDNIREEFGGLKSRKYEGQVRQEAKLRLKTALAKKENIIFDATNIREDFRKQIADTVSNYGGLSEVVCFGDSVENIISKDLKRKERFVGKEIIINQEKKFQFPKIGSYDLVSYI